MALDKAIDSAQLDANLTTIADAIRDFFSYISFHFGDV